MNIIKLWIDDIRPAPKGWSWMQSTNDAIEFIKRCEKNYNLFHDDMWIIEGISLDHDAGDYAADGEDYINILVWMEYTGRSYPIQLHTMNVVGYSNMKMIIQHNNWKEF